MTQETIDVSFSALEKISLTSLVFNHGFNSTLCLYFVMVHADVNSLLSTLYS